MLSILIPTYNYNVEALVHELHAQSTACNIEFEIIIGDDFSNTAVISTTFLSENKFTYLHNNDKSMGRTSTRHLLTSKARYPWLLFIDADMLPKDKNYINNNPWGYFNFNWGFHNSFYDPFWNYSPFFFNRGFYRPYWGLSFYDPYYRFGYGYYGYPYFGSPYRYGYRGYYGNRYDRGFARSPYSRGSGRYANANNSRGGRYDQNFSRSDSSRSNNYNGVNTDPASYTSRYNEGRRPPSQTTSRANSQVTRNANTKSNQNSSYNNRSQSNSNYSSRSRSNYNSGRSNSSSRSYSSGGRTSSYSSGSRGSSSRSSSGSRGR